MFRPVQQTASSKHVALVSFSLERLWYPAPKHVAGLGEPVTRLRGEVLGSCDWHPAGTLHLSRMNPTQLIAALLRDTGLRWKNRAAQSYACLFRRESYPRMRHLRVGVGGEPGPSPRLRALGSADLTRLLRGLKAGRVLRRGARNPVQGGRAGVQRLLRPSYFWF